MGKRNLKQKALAVDDIELTLSDLEEDRSPAQVVVDKLSADRRRIARDEHTVQVNGTQDKRADTSPPDRDYFIPEFNDLDVEEFQKEKKSFGDQPSRKRRYISSVRHSHSLALDILLSEMYRFLGLATEELVPLSRRIFGRNATLGRERRIHKFEVPWMPCRPCRLPLPRLLPASAVLQSVYARVAHSTSVPPRSGVVHS